MKYSMKQSYTKRTTALICSVAFFCMPVQSVQAAGLTITDSNHQQVTVPDHIARIADAWPAHNEILAMLGAGNNIVATVHSPQSRPWLYKISPRMQQAKTVFHNGASASLEELLATKPDVMFTTTMDTNAHKIASIGIPTVQLEFHDYPSMEHCISLTAKVLGGDAIPRAAAYNAYLDSKITQISAVTKTIPATQKPRVLHITASSPLTVDGNKTIIDQWITIAGGINVAAGVPGAMKTVTLEQIVDWNPDVIIVGADSRNFQEVLASNPAWHKISAVKNHRVIYNPDGAFLWDRYGAEEALQVQWAAKVLHPAQFKSIDMMAETRYFYQKFLNYPLSDDDIAEILKSRLNHSI